MTKEQLRNIIIFFFCCGLTLIISGCKSINSSKKFDNKNSKANTEELPYEELTTESKKHYEHPVSPVTSPEKRTMASVSKEYLETLSPSAFNEIWGYLISGEDRFYSKDFPITDIGYFGAGLSTFGKLVDAPPRSKVPETNARVHMVVIDSGRALTHFCLDPEFKIRNTLIDSLIKASADYDGLQIDFELVSADDKEHYLSFLRELKSKLKPNQILSVAIPARTKKLTYDAYDYEKIASIVDRIIVMAYDEHWSTSGPGPIASVDWCKNVLAYAQSTIPREKFIMGQSFYGRAWSNDNTAGAYKFSSIDRLFRGENAKGKLSDDTKISRVHIDNGIPTFTLSKEVTYTFYFDNAWSLSKRLKMYETAGVKGVSFWRFGQEDSDIWKLIKLK
ncbi:MAG: glycoside hydrolase [Treponema sp.]|jgi:hypothetical protein|nr:glycoside hydrolase [Treponema sp.]